MSIDEAVEQVYYWQYSNTGSFFNQLITLFQKADGNNIKKLNSAYPEIFLAIEMWKVAGDNGDDLFRDFGLME